MSGTYNITIEQGATFSVVITWNDENDNPVNLTNYTARMKIRETKESAQALLELTTENERIALGGAAGTIALTIAAADTKNLAFAGAVYDLELVSAAGVVTRLLEGEVTLSKEVTR